MWLRGLRLSIMHKLGGSGIFPPLFYVINIWISVICQAVCFRLVIPRRPYIKLIQLAYWCLWPHYLVIPITNSCSQGNGFRCPFPHELSSYYPVSACENSIFVQSVVSFHHFLRACSTPGTRYAFVNKTDMISAFRALALVGEANTNSLHRYRWVEQLEGATVK